MAKARGVEAKLLRLRSLRNQQVAAAAVEELRAALGDVSNLVVAEAAAVIGDSAVQELAQDLVAAFERLMIEPEQSDKQCRGKIALVEALNKLEYAGPEVFLRGIAHVQEPRWGDPDQDTAGPLRAHCAFGLARINPPNLLLLLTDLLLDRDKAARAGAIRALGSSGSLAAIPLLRFKAQLGDKEAEVTGECFEALLELAPTQSLPFVGRFLHSGSAAVQEAAVFALAESRRPEAFTMLQDFWPRAPQDLGEAVLLAIAMLRIPAALDFLIALVAGKDPHSRAALSALAIHRHYDKTKERVAAAVKVNGEPGVQQWFLKKFPETEKSGQA
jgi:HEAT repeat protein